VLPFNAPLPAGAIGAAVNGESSTPVGAAAPGVPSSLPPGARATAMRGRTIPAGVRGGSEWTAVGTFIILNCEPPVIISLLGSRTRRRAGRAVCREACSESSELLSVSSESSAAEPGARSVRLIRLTRSTVPVCRLPVSKPSCACSCDDPRPWPWPGRSPAGCVGIIRIALRGRARPAGFGTSPTSAGGRGGGLGGGTPPPPGGGDAMGWCGNRYTNWITYWCQKKVFWVSNSRVATHPQL
jgi:hypothetical protein